MSLSTVIVADEQHKLLPRDGLGGDSQPQRAHGLMPSGHLYLEVAPIASSCCEDAVRPMDRPFSGRIFEAPFVRSVDKPSCAAILIEKLRSEISEKVIYCIAAGGAADKSDNSPRGLRSRATFRLFV